MCGLARSQPSPAAAVLVLDLGGGAAGGGGCIINATKLSFAFGCHLSISDSTHENTFCATPLL